MVGLFFVFEFCFAECELEVASEVHMRVGYHYSVLFFGCLWILLYLNTFPCLCSALILPNEVSNYFRFL